MSSTDILIKQELTEKVTIPAVKRCAQQVLREFRDQSKEFPGGSFNRVETDKKGNHRFRMTLKYDEDKDVLLVTDARPTRG